MNEQRLKEFLERLASGTYTNEEYALTSFLNSHYLIDLKNATLTELWKKR